MKMSERCTCSESARAFLSQKPPVDSVFVFEVAFEDGKSYLARKAVKDKKLASAGYFVCFRNLETIMYIAHVVECNHNHALVGN